MQYSFYFDIQIVGTYIRILFAIGFLQVTCIGLQTQDRALATLDYKDTVCLTQTAIIIQLGLSDTERAWETINLTCVASPQQPIQGKRCMSKGLS